MERVNNSKNIRPIDKVPEQHDFPSPQVILNYNNNMLEKL